MGKIYQALQEAQKNRSKVRVKASVPNSAADAPEAVKEEKVLTLTPELEAEKEMGTLYQNIEATAGQARKKIIQFIGSHPGEGTSTIARDFARFLASRMGKKVLFLDGDPANPSGDFFGGSRMISLEESVHRGEEVEKAFAHSEETGLSISLVAREEGSLVHFLESEDRSLVWERLKERFDLVVIDSPPLSASSAGLGFCRRADGVVLVLEADRTRGPVAERAKEQIQKNSGNILGVVFNKRRFHIPKGIYGRL